MKINHFKKTRDRNILMTQGNFTSEAEKILSICENSHEFRTIDTLSYNARKMALTAINIALLLNNKNSIGDFDIEIKDNTVNLLQKSYYDITQEVLYTTKGKPTNL